MPARSTSRGHEIYCNSDGIWKYTEDDSIFDDSKPCKRCGHVPNVDGSDFCIGHINTVTSACCGHGIEEPFVVFDSGERFRGEEAKRFFIINKARKEWLSEDFINRGILSEDTIENLKRIKDSKMDKCKYYDQEVEIVGRYIDCLYDLPECSCGGMLHIVVDDDNVEDHNLDYSLDYIKKENEIDREIDELILKHMKNMPIEQRRLLTIGRNWRFPFDCPAREWGLKDCSECIIENENID